MSDIFKPELVADLIEDARLLMAEQSRVERKLHGVLILLGQAKEIGRDIPDGLLDELHLRVFGRRKRRVAVSRREEGGIA